MADEFLLPHFSDDNPAAYAAMAWLRLLENNRFPSAWAALTADLRLLAVQDWIVQNPAVEDHPARAGMDRDELAAALSVEVPTHPLWEHGAAMVAERGVRGVTLDVLAGRRVECRFAAAADGPRPGAGAHLPQRSAGRG